MVSANENCKNQLWSAVNGKATHYYFFNWNKSGLLVVQLFKVTATKPMYFILHNNVEFYINQTNFEVSQPCPITFVIQTCIRMQDSSCKLSKCFGNYTRGSSAVGGNSPCPHPSRHARGHKRRQLRSYSTAPSMLRTDWRLRTADSNEFSHLQWFSKERITG